MGNGDKIEDAFFLEMIQLQALQALQRALSVLIKPTRP